jgi:protein disulfide-isomerase
MRSALRFFVLLAAARLAIPPAAPGQQGKLPWRPGDPPPTVAGLRLGAPRAVIDSVLGRPESVRSLGQGVVALGYRSKGIAVMYSDADSLAVLYLTSRAGGDIGGIRVGDAKDSLVARWGDPTSVEENVGLYQVGRWVIVVRLDSLSRVQLLGIGRVAEESSAEAEGPYDSTANARRDIEAALQASQRDHKLVLLDFGANWCLDCIVLARLFKDSTVAGYLAANFRVVHVDVGRFDRNLDTSKSYGDPISGGVPAAVVLSPSGEVIASTKDGAIESARSMNARQILHFLETWVAAAHR